VASVASTGASEAVPRFVGWGYVVAFVAVTLAGAAQAATTPAAAVGLGRLGLGVGCALYAVLGTLGLYAVERRGSRRHVQLLLGALAVVGGATTLASHGYTAMMLLGVVSASVLHLGTRGGLAASAVGAAIAVVAFAQRQTLWTASLQAEIAFGSGIAFVFVFSRIALSEQRARGRVERLVAELAAANDQLTAHAAQVEQLATAQERNRIAREIHDGLGHHLTVVHIQLEAAQVYLASDPARARTAIATAQQLAHEGLGEVRRSVALLRGSRPARPPLIEALAELSDESTAAGVATSMRIEGAPRRLAESIELTLYRATQEALTNAWRHARASRVGITLVFTELGSVRLRVEDDGAGAAAPGSGFGLRGMRERVDLIGGTLGITTAVDHGFAVELEVPG
jgi:signal transduction histidine kinase